MRIFKVIILSICFIQISAISQTSQYYIPEKHDILKELSGNWDVIFAANAEEATAPAVGRGTAVGKINYDGVLVELEAEMKYQVGEANNKIIIGYDINQKKYYFLTYNSQGRSPALFFGDYNSNKNEYRFLNKENGEVISFITLTFTREDKFIIRSFVKSNGKDKKTLEIAYIKESKE